MGKYEKIVKISDERIIRIYIQESLCIIEEYFFEKDEIHKSYRLCQNKDYGFYGWINTDLKSKEEMPSLTYDFNKEHPLYIPLSNLLNKEESLVIEDETFEINKKYMLINKEEEHITLSFINNLENDDVFKKFNINVKNNTNKLISNFFDETIELLVGEYQLNNSKEETKHYIKRIVPYKSVKAV